VKLENLHLKKIFFFFTFVIGVYIYKFYNPIDSPFFPKCPFLSLTGFECPGCGSQRAIYYLLNYDVYRAINENFLLVAYIPYIITGYIVDGEKVKNRTAIFLQKKMFTKKAIMINLYIIILWWILRNIF